MAKQALIQVRRNGGFVQDFWIDIIEGFIHFDEDLNPFLDKSLPAAVIGPVTFDLNSLTFEDGTELQFGSSALLSLNLIDGGVQLTVETGKLELGPGVVMADGPTNDLDIATKKYVDDSVSGSLTGNFVSAGSPEGVTGPANKGARCWDQTNDIHYIKTTDGGNTGWVAYIGG